MIVECHFGVKAREAADAPKLDSDITVAWGYSRDNCVSQPFGKIIQNVLFVPSRYAGADFGLSRHCSPPWHMGCLV